MSTFYSDLIEESFESFFKRINDLKEEKGFINDTNSIKILGFTFIFIDTKKCQSFVVEESELNTKEVEISRYSNIVVLLNTKTKYASYWNHNYEFIGILNRFNNKSNIEFDSIAISSISFSSDFNSYHYNGSLISKINIVFTDNPFSKYLEKTIKPIRKALMKNFSEKIKDACYLNTEEIMETFSLSTKRFSEFNISEFSKILKEIKELDENITNNLIYHKFKPEDYSD